MPFTTLDRACKKIDKVRKKIETYDFCGKNCLKVTISAGVSEFEGENLKDFIQKADKNLYEAKKSGRNRIVCKEK